MYNAKTIFDFIFSIIILFLSGPILILFLFFVWVSDFKNPIYFSNRVAKNNSNFKMYKIRTMIINADKTGVSSTSENDVRITRLGKTIRKFKVDELLQFVNVLMGDMSVVGPRPNTRNQGVDLYTKNELKLLNVKPGITDLSSIVFSDEANILKNSKDPDLSYNYLIRPWKSRLGLFYIEHSNFSLDIKIIWLTIVSLFNREKALSGIKKILYVNGAEKEIIDVCLRKKKLIRKSPP
jgi:Sugar transferases involved in lipopolysaccharide synthesis